MKVSEFEQRRKVYCAIVKILYKVFLHVIAVRWTETRFRSWNPILIYFYGALSSATIFLQSGLVFIGLCRRRVSQEKAPRWRTPPSLQENGHSKGYQRWYVRIWRTNTIYVVFIYYQQFDLPFQQWSTGAVEVIGFKDMFINDTIKLRGSVIMTHNPTRRWQLHSVL